MGQCQSDSSSLSGDITSLPPTLSLPSSRSLEAEYSPPKLLSPRKRKAIVQQEVITTLSPPQSPAATVATRSKQNIKEAVEDQIRSIGMTIEASSNIDVVDINPKLMTPLRATDDKHDILTPHVSSSPPIPFHKQALATPRLNIGTDKTEAAVIAVKKEDIKVSGAKKLEERYEGVLYMFLVYYIAAIAFFFIMCRSLLCDGVAPDVPVMDGTQVATVATLDTNKLGSLQAIGHFNLQEDLMPLLPLNAVKKMLSDNKHIILDTIEQELSEMIHDDAVMI